MLVIRQAQLEGMANARWREFERFAVGYCQEQYATACAMLGSESTARLVSAALTRARGCGFEATEDLIGYLDLLFTIGLDFDHQPWAAEILGMSAYLPATRLQMLREGAANGSRGPEAQPAAEADRSASELSVAWPKPEPQPVPPRPVLLPPDSSCLPPPDEFRRGRTGR
jgi:hypothetical protein